jgi:hypothetical protein
MPNEGIGRVAPHGNQKQARQALLTARQNRRRQSSPESQTRPLPKLISIKDLEGLRHDVPPVSRLLSSAFGSLLILIFLSQLAPAATVNTRAVASIAPGKAGGSNATPARTQNTDGVRTRNPPRNE